MQYWAEQPIAREKLVVGVPFYGWRFTGVKNAWLVPVVQYGRSPVVSGGTNDAQIVSSVSVLLTSAGGVPWLYSEDENEFISYDDAHSVMEKQNTSTITVLVG